MGAVELFFFYLLAAAAPLSLAAINAAQGGLTLFFLWRLARLRYRPGTAAEWLLLALFAWSTVAALASPLRHDALVGVLNYWSWTPLLVGASLPASIRERFRTFAGFLALSACLTVPMSAASFFLGTDFHRNALTSRLPVGAVNAYGFFSHHLTYAGMLLAVISVAAAQALYGPPKGRKAFGLAAAVEGAGLVMSLARTYFLAAAPAAVILLWKKGRRWVLAGALAAALGVVLLLAVGPQSLRSRITSIWDLNNASNAERIYLWVAGAHMVADRPLTGFGPGVYEKVADPYKAPYAGNIHYPDHEGFRTVSHAHNLYLMMAIQAGIPGLLLFMALAAAAFAGMVRAPDPVLRYAAMAAFAAFLAGGIFEFNGGDAEVSTIVFFLVGLALNRRD